MGASIDAKATTVRVVVTLIRKARRNGLSAGEARGKAR